MQAPKTNPARLSLRALTLGFAIAGALGGCVVYPQTNAGYSGYYSAPSAIYIRYTPRYTPPPRVVVWRERQNHGRQE